MGILLNEIRKNDSQYYLLLHINNMIRILLEKFYTVIAMRDRSHSQTKTDTPGDSLPTTFRAHNRSHI